MTVGCTADDIQESDSSQDDRLDASFFRDTPDKHLDSNQEPNPVDAGSDSVHQQVGWLEPGDTSPWENPPTCTGTGRIVERLSDRAFAKPDLENPSGPEKRTVVFWDEYLEGLRRFFDLSPAWTHEPGRYLAYDLYADVGEDVVLHMGLGSPYDPELTKSVSLSFYLDQEPVNVEIRHLDGGREEIFKEVFDDHLFLISTREIDIVDVTIPAERMVPGRMHEFSVDYRRLRSGRANRGSSRRLPIFYGGYDPPTEPLPCTVPPLRDSPNDFEEEYVRNRGFNLALLFTDPAPYWTYEERTAKTGETRRFYYSVFSYAESGPHTAVIRPTLNAEPLGEPVWIEHSGTPEEFSSRELVDYRNHFDVTFPDEPGLYEVGLSVIEDPWKRWRHFGTLDPQFGIDGIANGEVRSGAYPIRVRVTDD